MEKRKYPRTVLRKRIVKIVFWTMTGYVVIASTFALIRPTSPTPVQAQVQEQKPMNPATGPGVGSFANNLAYEYFLWNKDPKVLEERKKRLAPYLMEGIDPQAGLGIEGLDSSSKLMKSQVWDIEETGPNQAKVTLRVQYTLTENNQPAYKIKYFVVPITSDGKSFVVYDIPYFVPTPKKPEIQPEPEKASADIIHDSTLTTAISNFLDSFFKVYATGKPEEITYFSKINTIEGLHGTLDFVTVKKVEVYPTKQSDVYEIHTQVTFAEKGMKTKFHTPFVLKLQKEKERWFVMDLKHEE
ncbi:conjugal transfer protein [Ammoniphilus sp. YIM 78166]|uniref:conjugal transfer protein n=1 Tax=Ammoniphilus sp. YIM 78166 TaxID=1644106 RepID=UPI00106F0E6B|nr:conjugal transfer protein [Ammoniphilus sp. YIM 78166]